MTVRRISAAAAGTMLPVNGPHTDTTHYDALGRRVWTRTVYGDASCGSQCTELSSVTRFVWDGSQILGEIRDRGGVSTPDAEMEDDAPIVFDSLPCSFSADVPCDSTPTARVRGIYSAHVGRVEYVHGGGIDQPVLVIRRDYGGDSTFFGDIDIYPHANWRGETDQVTFFNGRGDYGSNQTHPVVELPAKNELGFHQTKEAAAGPLSWNGSLLAQQRDASGLMYMRNRYYDPQTGRFTQEDPIGLGGGMNLYGFANGDPVNFGDPFGLCKNAKGESVNPKECDSPIESQMTNRKIVQYSAAIATAGTSGGLLGTVWSRIVNYFASDEPPSSASVRLNESKQGKHVPGHNNYQPGRSVLAHDDPQSLLDQFAGTGDPVSGTPGMPGFKERVDFGQTIGEYVDPQTGVASPTTKGIIHYAKDGAHIVPARP